MAEQKSWFAKYWKSILKVVTAIFFVFYVSVFAWVWADRDYKSNFWPDFFMYSAIGVGLLLLVGWIILWTGRRDNS